MFLVATLGFEPRALNLPGKSSKVTPHPQSSFSSFILRDKGLLSS